jgi:hypothetical protein
MSEKESVKLTDIELVNMITDTMQGIDFSNGGKYLEDIANRVLAGDVAHQEDGSFILSYPACNKQEN